MDKVVNFGLGFVTGRPNVCKVINNTYEQLINQFKDTDTNVKLTIFILLIFMGLYQVYIKILK